MAWARSERAPRRSTSVSGSENAPGWESVKTLFSVTAYHSFVGEVGASNTTTIRRLTPSGRHQLLAIAPIHHAHAAQFQRHVDPGKMLHDCPPMMLGADQLGPRFTPSLWRTVTPPGILAEAHYGI